MANNFINYTGLTYDDIKADIMTRLSEDSRFANFRESALYSVITEIFAATTDFTNYYMERRAEESFLDSAQLRSSVVLLSKMLGYIITRPIPSSTSFKIRINSLPAGVQVGDSIELDAGTAFTFENKNFFLPQGVKYVITQTDINNFNDTTYFKELSYRATDSLYAGRVFDDEDSRSTSLIKLVQGERRTKEFPASTNSQMGKRYQTYSIDDPMFSNMFGNEDYGYSVSNPESNDITTNWTRVAIGDDEASAFCLNKSEFNSKREFWIDRRSFLNSDTIPLLSATGAGADVKYCVIRTSMTDGVELLFGDDNVSSVGAKSNKNVYVRYLATEGAKANTVGVIGKMIACSESSYGSNFNKRNIDFFLTSNITGGSDIEDMESIKINSPEIFYSLERCVTPRDYISFLKTLTLSTKNVKNAIAWGEQEEIRFNSGLANIKLFNVVLFSALSDMYAKINDSSLGEIYTGLDTESNIVVAPLSATDNDWFNVMMMSDSTTPLKNIQADDTAEMADLKRIYDKLYDRSQITVKNVYVSPIIQDFSLSGTVYFNPLIDKNTATKKINNAVYSYLSMNADFNTPVYNSTIVDIIEGFSEVHHADVFLTPKETIVGDNDSFSRSTSGNDSSVAQIFDSVPVGYVFSTSWTNKTNFGTREYSRTPVIEAVDIQKQTLTSNTDTKEISAYNSASYESIFCLMPDFQVKSYKIDSDFVQSTLIWPSSNEYDLDTCGPTTTATVNPFTNYHPSERNLYLGMMQCYLNRLKILAGASVDSNGVAIDSTNSVDALIAKWDALLASTQCICSLKEYKNTMLAKDKSQACNDNFRNAVDTEIADFINKYFYYYVKLLRNTFLFDIRQNMIDSNGNITNFSMRNEIARIDLGNLKYSYN